jgi:hypothetical protein
VPAPQIHNRADAVAYLTAEGFHAFARDWVLGETIGVAAEPFEAGGIQAWRRIVYIAPTGGGWEVHDLSRQADPPTSAVSLEAACHQAINALRAHQV